VSPPTTVVPAVHQEHAQAVAKDSLPLSLAAPNTLSTLSGCASSCQSLSLSPGSAPAVANASLSLTVSRYLSCARWSQPLPYVKSTRELMPKACAAMLQLPAPHYCGCCMPRWEGSPMGIPCQPARESQTTSSAMCKQCEKPSSRRPGSALPRGHSRHLSPHKAQGKHTNADDHEAHARNTGRQARGANAAPGRVSGHKRSRVSEE
jgi:hypothetical protein